MRLWERVVNLVADKLVMARGGLVLDSKKGKGIRVDLNDPQFTWRDLEGPIVASTTGANRPTLTSYIGNGEDYAFDAGDKYSLIKLHIPHDWAGEDMFIHTHWSHNGSNISGSLVIDYYITYAKGHGRVHSTRKRTSLRRSAVCRLPTRRQKRIELTRCNCLSQAAAGRFLIPARSNRMV